MTVLATTPQRNSRQWCDDRHPSDRRPTDDRERVWQCRPTTKEDRRKACRQAAERRIAELAKKHGANTNWTDSIKKTSADSGVFSFQRQEAFDPLIGHPILARVTIIDIYRAKDGYRLICRLSQSDILTVLGATRISCSICRQKRRSNWLTLPTADTRRLCRCRCSKPRRCEIQP